MAADTLRSITVRRTGAGRLVATNDRGLELPMGSGDDAFSPVELLLAGLAGCTGLDVEAITARRAEPETFELTATADKVRDESGNYLENVQVVFRVEFPDGESGEAAREVLPQAMQRSHDRLCTVTRTVERVTPVTYRLADVDGE